MASTRSIAIVAVLVVVVVGGAALYYFTTRPTPTEEMSLEVTSAVPFSEVYFLPMLIGQQEGIFEAHGLDVEWSPFMGGGPMYQGVATGEVEIGLSSVLAHIDAQARGLDIKITANYIPNNTFEIFVSPDSDIQGPQDLDGRVIGVSARGGLEEFMFLTLQKEFDIEYEQIVATGGLPNHFASLERGEIDAFAFTINTVLEQLENNQLRSIHKMEDSLPSPWQEFIVFATDDLLEERPEATRRFNDALLETVQFIEDNPDVAIQVYMDETDSPRDIAETAIANLQWNTSGDVEREAISTMLDAYVAVGLIEEGDKPSVDDIYTNEFLPLLVPSESRVFA